MLTRNSGYSTAHAVKVFHKFFPSPQTANVRFMVSPPYWQAHLNLECIQKTNWLTSDRPSSSVPMMHAFQLMTSMCPWINIKRTWRRSFSTQRHAHRTRDSFWSVHLPSMNINWRGLMLQRTPRSQAEPPASPSRMQWLRAKSAHRSMSRWWIYGPPSWRPLAGKRENLWLGLVMCRAMTHWLVFSLMVRGNVHIPPSFFLYSLVIQVCIWLPPVTASSTMKLWRSSRPIGRIRLLRLFQWCSLRGARHRNELRISQIDFLRSTEGESGLRVSV